MYIIRYRTLLLRSYFCKKRKARIKAKTVLKRWTVCSSNHYRVRLIFFLWWAARKKKNNDGRWTECGALYRYRYVSIYVYSLHPLKTYHALFSQFAHISCRVCVCSLERSHACPSVTPLLRAVVVARCCCQHAAVWKGTLAVSCVQASLSGVQFPVMFLEYHPPSHKRDFCCKAQCVWFNSPLWRRSLRWQGAKILAYFMALSHWNVTGNVKLFRPLYSSLLVFEMFSWSIDHQKGPGYSCSQYCNTLNSNLFSGETVVRRGQCAVSSFMSPDISECRPSADRSNLFRMQAVTLPTLPLCHWKPPVLQLTSLNWDHKYLTFTQLMLIMQGKCNFSWVVKIRRDSSPIWLKPTTPPQMKKIICSSNVARSRMLLTKQLKSSCSDAPYTRRRCSRWWSSSR